jgi:hypothetical protein
MTDVRILPRLLSVLNSIDLWVFVGMAAAGYAGLFVPTFGGVDLAEFRNQVGGWCWLDAVAFSMLSLARATDLISKGANARAIRQRRRQRNIYLELYAPLYAELIKIHAVTSNSVGAPKLRYRLENALYKLRTVKKRGAALKLAWRSLFDRLETDERGEVEYGGVFPIDKIEYLIHSNLLYCDDALLYLLRQSVTTRIESQARSHDVTADDVRLSRHIFRERKRLKRVFDR